MMLSPKKVLTIAGSDSGGAAGLQADLKTLTALGVYGMSAVTAVTAQNSVSVNDVTWMSAPFLQAQLDAVLSDYGADGVKTGFLGRPPLIITTSACLQRHRPPHIVIDPVLVNHRGESMFPAVITDLYRIYLLPLAAVLTPNLPEAALLTGRPLPPPDDLAAIQAMAQTLQRFGADTVLIKGGHDRHKMVDVLFDGLAFTLLAADRVDTPNTHGAGDTLSAAICAYLAKGADVKTAVRQAHAFTHNAIKHAQTWRLGTGHGPLAHFI